MNHLYEAGRMRAFLPLLGASLSLPPSAREHDNLPVPLAQKVPALQRAERVPAYAALALRRVALLDLPRSSGRFRA